jgi:hypothetical protein
MHKDIWLQRENLLKNSSKDIYIYKKKPSRVTKPRIDNFSLV